MLYDAYYEQLQRFEDEEGSETGDSENDGEFNFARSLTLRGGILTVADELLQDNGHKFLDVMQRLAKRTLRPRFEDEASDEEEEEDEGEYDYDDEDLAEMTEEQRLKESPCCCRAARR